MPSELEVIRKEYRDMQEKYVKTRQAWLASQSKWQASGCWGRPKSDELRQICVRLAEERGKLVDELVLLGKVLRELEKAAVERSSPVEKAAAVMKGVLLGKLLLGRLEVATADNKQCPSTHA